MSESISTNQFTMTPLTFIIILSPTFFGSILAWMNTFGTSSVIMSLLWFASIAQVNIIESFKTVGEDFSSFVINFWVVLPLG